jgi:hypothetical protein
MSDSDKKVVHHIEGGEAIPIGDFFDMSQIQLMVDAAVEEANARHKDALREIVRVRGELRQMEDAFRVAESERLSLAHALEKEMKTQSELRDIIKELRNENG